MNNSDTGRQLKAALQIVKDGEQQVAALFVALDEGLRGPGLRPTHKRTLGQNQTARTDNASDWTPAALYRIYCLAGGDEEKAQTRFLIVEVQLLPEAADEPQLVCALVEMSDPVPPRSLWATHWGRDADDLWSVLGGPLLQPAEIPVEQLRGAIAIARRGRAFTVPLCSITDENLGSLVVGQADALFQST